MGKIKKHKIDFGGTVLGHTLRQIGEDSEQSDWTLQTWVQLLLKAPVQTRRITGRDLEYRTIEIRPKDLPALLKYLEKQSEAHRHVTYKDSRELQNCQVIYGRMMLRVRNLVNGAD